MSFEKYIWTEKVLRLPHGAVTAANFFQRVLYQKFRNLKGYTI